MINLKKKSLLMPSFLMPALILMGCAHNPNRAHKIKTKLNNAQAVSGDTEVGVQNGNLVVERKVLMGEKLRRLQNDVYALQDHVYGSREFGSLGLYGILRHCHEQLADENNGGNGHLIFTEPLDRVVKGGDEFKIGLDEKHQIVAVSEEFLKARIQRFETYKQILEDREDELDQQIEICKTQLKAQRYKYNHRKKTAQSS